MEAEFWKPISEAVDAAVRERRLCLMCIAGNTGCGKSTLGKKLRKAGIGPILPREILVIDDGVASVPFLGVFRRRVKFRTKEKDFLRPFEPYFRGKKLVVFVSVQPVRRLEECDILLEVTCTEEMRLRHLRQRNVDGDKRFSDTAGYRLVKPRGCTEFQIENNGEVFVLRSQEAL